jgi:THO complex subunit 2
MQSRIDALRINENVKENDYWDEEKFVLLKKDSIWKSLKPEIYFIFWFMSLQNLVVCEQVYKDEIKRINEQIEETKNAKPAAAMSG